MLDKYVTKTFLVVALVITVIANAALSAGIIILDKYVLTGSRDMPVSEMSSGGDQNSEQQALPDGGQNDNDWSSLPDNGQNDNGWSTLPDNGQNDNGWSTLPDDGQNDNGWLTLPDDGQNDNGWSTLPYDDQNGNGWSTLPDDGQNDNGWSKLPDDGQNGYDQSTPQDGYQEDSQSQSSGPSIGIVIKEDNGVYVVQVNGQNAQKAGFAEGDKIVAIDGNNIGSTSDVIAVLQNHKTGDSVKVTVDRNGQSVEITTVLE